MTWYFALKIMIHIRSS